jgi:prepilin-type processing-associated H-X9-DG protein
VQAPAGGAPREPDTEARPRAEEIVRVRRTAEGWKIVSSEQEALESAVDAVPAANVLAFLVRNPDVVRRARPQPQAASTSNAKQIATGLMMYVQDYDQVFVPNAAKYAEAIMPYMKNRAALTSPLDPPGTVSYKFNPQLAGKSMAAVKNPANMVMLFEGEYKKPLFRYEGRAVIGFADGHVKLVTPQEAARLRWTPP